MYKLKSVAFLWCTSVQLPQLFSSVLGCTKRPNLWPGVKWVHHFRMRHRCQIPSWTLGCHQDVHWSTDVHGNTCGASPNRSPVSKDCRLGTALNYRKMGSNMFQMIPNAWRNRFKVTYLQHTLISCRFLRPVFGCEFKHAHDALEEAKVAPNIFP